jgi:predicted branched-subunit amino acid permease
MDTPRSELLAGIKAELPLLVGVAPFGMIYGVLAINAGIAAIPAQAMSAIVFAGSSQLIATQLVAFGTPTLVMILTIAVVNLRHALYSASIAPYLESLPPAWKLLLAYLLTDEAYAVAIQHYNNGIPARNKHWFFLGSGFALWFTWQTSTAAGVFLGAQIPTSWSLDFTLALTFIALVIPTIKSTSVLGVVVTAGFLAVVLYPLPYKVGLMIASLFAIGVGVFMEGKE